MDSINTGGIGQSLLPCGPLFKQLYILANTVLTKINLKVQSTMGPQGADRFLTSFYNSVILTLRLGTRIGLYGFLAMADVRPA